MRTPGENRTVILKGHWTYEIDDKGKWLFLRIRRDGEEDWVLALDLSFNSPWNIEESLNRFIEIINRPDEWTFDNPVDLEEESST